MNRIEELAQAVASGTVIEGVDRSLLLMRDCDATCDWTGAAGPAHPATGGQLSTEHPFRAGSITQLVTSTAVLRACDLSLVGLDKSVANYLPADLVERLHVLDGESRGGDITIRQLLDHTSGLPDYLATAAVQDSMLDGSRRRGFTPRDLVEIAIASGPPEFVPGAGQSYTNTGYVLAGMILEEVTGLALHDVYREFVLDRVGMDSTWLEGSGDSPRSGPITHHTSVGVDITDLLDPTIGWASSGLVTTASDLAALMAELTSGDLLTLDSWRELTDWQAGPDGRYDGYGLGLGRYQVGEFEVIGVHGGWGAFVFALPFDVVVAGTVNTAGADQRPLLEAVLDTLCTA